MTPFLRFPVVALAAASLALIFIAIVGVRRRMLSRSSRTLLLITAAFVLTGIVPLVIRGFRTPNPANSQGTARAFQVAIEFSVHQPNAEIVKVPFTVGSGSVNIGCEEQRSVTVQFPLPQGAEQPIATALWVNTNNIASQTSNVTVQPTVVAAVGSIQGLPRTFLLNCPGGGHGELVLRGEYSMTHKLPDTPVVVKTLHETAAQGQIFAATLPQEANSQPVYFTATISDGSDSSLVKGTITPAANGDYALTTTDRKGPLPSEIRLVRNSLVMTL